MAVNVAEYAVPTWPLGREEVEIVSVCPAGAIVKLKVWLAVCCGELESVTRKVNEIVPTCDGVPLSCPVAPFTVSQDGNDEPGATDQVYGAVPPVADNVTDQTEFTFPLGKEDVEIFRTAGAGGESGLTIPAQPDNPKTRALKKTNKAIVKAVVRSTPFRSEPEKLCLQTILHSPWSFSP
jgi:hypothetical protein